ncbi:HAD-IA family hydrolase [Williamsia deligens]|uniref:HAD-IA family hydrolase n=1 Tax=Williamsia deligens TaxID=321325 RepID=A0ABW3G7Q1_9NOCA|nr:HAD-IA family hydrolase [Williamsia deligens]MCP2192939.1 putative hydrolase of the HAD superfamily [Williamsia deligens]
MTARPVGGSPFVWFDFGGVLSPPLDELFLRYEQVTGIPVAVLKRAIETVGAQSGLPPLAAIELAVVDERTWVTQLHDAIRAERPDLDLSRSEPDFGRQWFDGHVVNAGIRDLAVELLDAGVQVGILSNNVVEWEPYWRPMVGLDDVVTDLVDSCRVGVRKPDPAIFALAAERNGVRPEDNILVDDLAENCAAARAAGWRAIHFTDTASAVAEVRAAVGALAV